ncbi:MerR family DNA-binding transcriptional regulator [Mycolicibacterium sp. 018/SC-01/001]|uniref:MerR family DNA-binding transcriptional regulator n=1 Tax=Mycolicibacterium sp. 018/SC-01/001 TaxID=2592069 RepID=UPI001180629D|nr:MerR family DNA-binding transcriptional regulator [Mycolicibacterium sp. 018/SC-01/001]
MHISELARLAGVTPKAVRYYESLGLITPVRAANGYREYDAFHVRAVIEIRTLSEVGITPANAHPFIECLDAGHTHSDDCPSSLAVYRDSIAEIDRIVELLSRRRAQLMKRLHKGGLTGSDVEIDSGATDYTILPPGLPEPADDGRASHLPGMTLPDIALRASDGTRVQLGHLPAGRTIIYLYPLTGRPGIDLPDGWDAIPGARGCSTEACNFRDHFSDLQDLGVEAVFGLSSQDVDYQDEVVQRLHLPFSMLSDPDFHLAERLDLPTFSATGHPRLYSRLTLIVNNGTVEHVFYPIFPPNAHAGEVCVWLRLNPVEHRHMSRIASQQRKDNAAC